MLKKLKYPPVTKAVIAMVATGGFFYAVLQKDAPAAFMQATLTKLSSIAPAAGDAPPLALHKALYGLDLVSVESGAGIVGIKGAMYYEQDDACDAWTTDQRFTMEYQYPERRPVNSTSHYVAWEAKDGARMEFNSERQENGRETELLRGAATRAQDGAGKAEYTRPGGLSFALPQGYFLPTAHTQDIINRAKSGEKFFTATLFDGTDADGPVEISAAIGKKATRAEIDGILKEAGGKADASLLGGDAWHMRIAVFPLKDADNPVPSYEMDVIQHENGVVSYALVDYKSFKVEQKLKTIEKLAQKPCP